MMCFAENVSNTGIPDVNVSMVENRKTDRLRRVISVPSAPQQDKDQSFLVAFCLFFADEEAIGQGDEGSSHTA